MDVFLASDDSSLFDGMFLLLPLPLLCFDQKLNQRPK
jgi:hypothetical protein